jgi:colicin import membrane protein
MASSRKVYEAHLGFYDTIVAALSQKSALAAWGSTSDLFRMGIAKPTNDPKKVKAALAKPGLVLRRPAGTDIAFSENPPLPKPPTGKLKKKRE